MFPPPVQRAPKIWITAGGSPDTFEMAGRLGASILTNLLGDERRTTSSRTSPPTARPTGRPGIPATAT